MTDLKTKTLREVAEGATPGPWAVEGDALVTLDPVENEYERRLIADLRYFTIPKADTNARFIQAFDPPTCLALLDRIEELEARLDKLAVAARTHLATHPVFRQRVGDEGSRARLLQADQIATENALFAALKDTPNG
jgi:hypothetical protein